MGDGTICLPLCNFTSEGTEADAGDDDAIVRLKCFARRERAIVVRKAWYKIFSKKRRVQIEKLIKFSNVARMRRQLVSVVFL